MARAMAIGGSFVRGLLAGAGFALFVALGVEALPRPSGWILIVLAIAGVIALAAAADANAPKPPLGDSGS